VLDALFGDRYFIESVVLYVSAMLKFSIPALLVAYTVTLVYGVPAHIGLSLMDKNNIPAHALMGGLGGLLVAFVAPVGNATQILIVLCGAVVAVSFWSIAKP